MQREQYNGTRTLTNLSTRKPAVSKVTTRPYSRDHVARACSSLPGLPPGYPHLAKRPLVLPLAVLLPRPLFQPAALDCTVSGCYRVERRGEPRVESGERGRRVAWSPAYVNFRERNFKQREREHTDIALICSWRKTARWIPHLAIWENYELAAARVVAETAENGVG